MIKVYDLNRESYLKRLRYYEMSACEFQYINASMHFLQF